MINRAVRFYFEQSKEIYNREYTLEYDLENKIYPVFNPILPAVNTLSSMALQSNISIKSADQSAVDALVESSNIQGIKYALFADLILFDYAVIYINDAGIKRYNPTWIELEKDREGNIVTIIVSGQNSAGLEIKRRYYMRDGKCYFKDDYEPEVNTGLSFVPFAVVSSNYDIEHLVDIADDINQKKAWLKNIYKYHGNPILRTDDTSEIQAPPDHNKGLKVLAGINLGYLEMTGEISRQIKEDITELKEDAANDYPESCLSRVLAGSNISENTSYIRFSDLSSKVNRLRGEFEELLNEAIGKYFLISGRIVFITVEFEPIFPVRSNYDDETKIADLAVKYKDLGSLALWNEYRERNKLPIFDETNFTDLKSSV